MARVNCASPIIAASGERRILSVTDRQRIRRAAERYCRVMLVQALKCQAEEDERAAEKLVVDHYLPLYQAIDNDRKSERAS
jgi:hypothetical protein